MSQIKSVLHKVNQHIFTITLL